MLKKGTVTKCIAGKFTVFVEGTLIECYARKKFKKEQLLAGDIVEIDDQNCVIENILPRKNKLIRPPIANIDRIIIVVSCVPYVDFHLVDKLIIAAKINQIEPVLCFNKVDLDNDDLAKKIQNQYKQSNIRFIQVSAKTGYNIDKLIQILKGGINCFAGQSAVGKSSLINDILGCDYSIVGDLSQKILRGKNTTRHTEIISLDDYYVADTPGFNLLELDNLEYNKLKDYYVEFNQYKNDCKFSSCAHINEPQCSVKQAANEDKISKERYLRYIDIYSDLKKEQSYT
jgi:ribosome biogenesis GTPase